MMHRDLIALREKAIPSLLEARSRHVDYRHYSIDTSSNYFGEELIDITTLGSEAEITTIGRTIRRTMRASPVH